MVPLSKLDADDLVALVDGLLSTIPQEESTTVISIKPETVVTPPHRESSESSPIYNPALVFALEFAASLALRDEETIEVLGKQTAEALQMILREAAQYHTVVVSRASYYLLHLVRASHVRQRPQGRRSVVGARHEKCLMLMV